MHPEEPEDPARPDAIRSGPPGRGCRKCNAPLKPIIEAREVACAFCSTVNANPEPLPAGTEVVAPTGFETYALATVISASGPDQVVVQWFGRNEQTFRTHRVEELVRTQAITDDALPDSLVFAQQLGTDYGPTRLVSVGPAECVVRHENPEFQDDFFNKRLPRAQVRMAVRSELRAAPALRRRTDFFARFPLLVWAGPVLFILALAIFFAFGGGSPPE